MKLDKKLKERIDSYFDKISANELYFVLTEKYKFKDIGSGIVIVNNGNYLYREDKISEFSNDIIHYTDIDIKQEIEVVKMKFLENISNIQNEKIVYDKSCSIPLAA